MEGLCLYPGGTDGGNTDGSTESSGIPADTSGRPPGEDGPEVLTLAAGTGGLFQGNDLLIGAVVSDPDGVEDVQGGVLLVQDGPQLADFLPLEPGSWQLVLTWEMLDAAQPIVDGTVVLRADFVDAAGNVGSEEVSITACVAGSGACPIASEGGTLECVDLQSNEEHCGSCEQDCGNYEECIEGTCEMVEETYGTGYGIGYDEPDPDQLDDIEAVPYGVPLPDEDEEVTVAMPRSTGPMTGGGFRELSDATRNAFNLSSPQTQPRK